MSPFLPPQIWDALREFMAEGKSGQVIFEVREGAVVACRVTQSIRVPSCANAGMEYKVRA